MIIIFLTFVLAACNKNVPMVERANMYVERVIKEKALTILNSIDKKDKDSLLQALVGLEENFILDEEKLKVSSYKTKERALKEIVDYNKESKTPAYFLVLTKKSEIFGNDAETFNKVLKAFLNMGVDTNPTIVGSGINSGNPTSLLKFLITSQNYTSLDLTFSNPSSVESFMYEGVPILNDLLVQFKNYYQDQSVKKKIFQAISKLIDKCKELEYDVKQWAEPYSIMQPILSLPEPLVGADILDKILNNLSEKELTNYFTSRVRSLSVLGTALISLDISPEIIQVIAKHANPTTLNKRETYNIGLKSALVYAFESYVDSEELDGFEQWFRVLKAILNGSEVNLISEEVLNSTNSVSNIKELFENYKIRPFNDIDYNVNHTDEML